MRILMAHNLSNKAISFFLSDITLFNINYYQLFINHYLTTNYADSAISLFNLSNPCSHSNRIEIFFIKKLNFIKKI